MEKFEGSYEDFLTLLDNLNQHNLQRLQQKLVSICITSVSESTTLAAIVEKLIESKLENLQELDLYNNQLTGAIPSQLGICTV